ncbi:3D domain-containing protein [Lederbergia citrea]|uniref:LysM peptidoglycan-binding domain-containing protein n=1 Tax=Lederbergia citrea TaxID=2833581 RepID=A0A942Z4I5_9BACI|nr:3D domain-containing protein [Lederbergia citrea]MBS4177803.1 LysM peptidoglycan-binding domain-containing protein [Lederbergia citrea]MBS4204476.1 LysM peptidoglycan-binding domain-containing protein [Lederbergia citrea]MBS4223679.1 LysM peptidoglycan-binding domain-containing protein [Lederbergia citrea]
MKKIVISMMTACFLIFGISGVSQASAATTTYKVQKGDSLWSIATKYKVTVNQLKSWNGLKKDIIKPKQVLKITKPKATATKKTTTSKKVVKTTKKAKYKTLTVKATAYTAGCKGCSGITATGINLKKNPNAKVISVDPKVIPLGTKVYVEGYGEAIAGDTGGAIKGKKIDLHMPTKKKAFNWGVRTVKVKVYR